MEKVHTKTNKLFDEIRKKKVKLTKNIKDSTKLINGDIADLPYKCCIYCEKVFLNSKFLMKHLLRRHSDELVLFYRNYTNRDFNYNSNDLQHIIDILHTEFSSLKKELCSDKLAVEEKHETNSFEKNQVNGEEQTTHTVKRNQMCNDDIVSNEISDLKLKMLDVEKDIQNLNDKFLELDCVLKNEVLKKQDVHELLVSSEEKIMQAQKSQFIELKQILLSELKSILHNQQEDINSDWKSQLLELKHEIKRLDYAINNVKQITCIDSLKEDIKFELLPQIIPHMKFKEHGKRRHHHVPARSELSINKSCSSSQLRKMSQQETISSRKSNYKSVRKHPETSLKNVDKLSSIVADKLSEFSIAPNTSKLSSAEYNKISKLINFEKEQLERKYGNFYEIYNKINKTADQRVHSKLKSKKHHKIKFSEPLTSSRISLNHSMISLKDVMPEQSTKNPLHLNSKSVSEEKTSPTAESTNFNFPDKGASGDSVHPFSHKQKIPVEHTKSVKRIETSSPVEDIMRSNDLTASYSVGDITVAEQHKYNKHANCLSPVEQREFNSPVNNHSSKLKEKFSFTDIGDSGEFFHPVTNKQMIPHKQAKLSYTKEFGNASSIDNIKNFKDLNATFSKDGIISDCQVNCQNQRKLNSAIGNPSVHFEKNLIFKTKTLDKLSEQDEYCNSDNDFDDVSSLETYKSSDDDDHIAGCS